MTKPKTEPTRAFIIANLLAYDSANLKLLAATRAAADDEAAGKLVAKSWGYKHWPAYTEAAAIVRSTKK